MKRNKNNRRNYAVWTFITMMVLSLCLSMMAPNTAEAAGKKKAVKSVTLTVNGQKANGRTISVKRGTKVKVYVTANPAGSKKSVSYASNKKKVASVSKGRISAKKNGTAKVTVRVKGKNGKTKKAWLKVRVVNTAPASTASSGSKNSSKNTSASSNSNNSRPSAHQHTWAEHKAAKTVEKSFVAKVADTKRYYHCVCGWECPSEEESKWYEHDVNHLRLNEESGNWFVNKPTGTYHDEVQTYTETVHYVDYYYCTGCGARK